MDLNEYIQSIEQSYYRFDEISDIKILSRNPQKLGKTDEDISMKVSFSALKQSIIDLPDLNGIWTLYESYILIDINIYKTFRRDELIDICLNS